ncbi:diaminopimelate epimerase [Zavarzinia compransoris]|uniref:Diaminopimelate epimerase n=1 Tax=Zavarzinia compransoris TaxID=1264899 RepID=A0A317E5Z4_9PROT|nr:diaminopimelate epimerase [Zavarzinia compransoris]PWR22081.1 diaminopimelate epimerase [Zavarzinia compransoris]TDP47176.1 diaminopimelate epimerase [Zavarzinia compransoris]
MDGIPFIKMHGLGNDFVIVDSRTSPVEINEPLAQAIANRRTGVGCDQLIVLETSDKADVFMRIWNADGTEAGACGNATRCVGALLIAGARRNQVGIETVAGVLLASSAPDGYITVDMGRPRLGWQEIPLAREMDTVRLDYAAAPGIATPAAVSMGNPHVVFFVDDADRVKVEALGPAVESDPLFPERANVSFVSKQADGALRVVVWERGAGRTPACGSAACAVVVAATRRGLVERKAAIWMDGGRLDMEWRAEDDHVIMTGPVAVAFSGVIALPPRVQAA